MGVSSGHLLQPEGTTVGFISRGFRRRTPDTGAPADRLPPGQYDVGDRFPVLSAGPTPRTPVGEWDLTIATDDGPLRRWSWDEFQALPHEAVTADVHCVTRWSKFDTRWSGVSIDALLGGLDVTRAGHVLASCDGDYTTNLPLADVTGGRAWIVDRYGDGPLEPEHGGPARLLVPHLYFWKSAKWVRRLTLLDQDRPGFWERLGYHNYGDPWREQRYAGD